MGGYPPLPGSDQPPPQDGYPTGPPPPPSSGWSAPPAPPPSDAGAPYGAPYGYAPPAGQGYWGAPPYAGWWTRFVAFVIDGIVTTLFFVPAYITLFVGPTEIESCSVDSSGNIDLDGTVQNGLCEVPTGGTIAAAVVLGILGFVGVLVYWAKLEGGSGQTLGKRALGIRTVDATTGRPIGSARAIGRYFARILSALPCYLGYLWAAWDPQKQAWHDKIVNTFVVKA